MSDFSHRQAGNEFQLAGARPLYRFCQGDNGRISVSRTNATDILLRETPHPDTLLLAQAPPQPHPQQVLYSQNRKVEIRHLERIT